MGCCDQSCDVAIGNARLVLFYTPVLLSRNTPVSREIEHPANGAVIAIPDVGGFHRRYTPAVAT